MFRSVVAILAFLLTAAPAAGQEIRPTLDKIKETGLITFGSLIGLLVTKWQEIPESASRAQDRTELLKGFGAWLVCFGAVYIASAMKMARSVPQSPLPRDAASPFA